MSNPFADIHQNVHDLAVLIVTEAGGESKEGQIAVAQTVMNRVAITGASLHDVIYTKWQFTGMYPDTSSSPKLSNRPELEDQLIETAYNSIFQS